MRLARLPSTWHAADAVAALLEDGRCAIGVCWLPCIRGGERQASDCSKSRWRANRVRPIRSRTRSPSGSALDCSLSPLRTIGTGRVTLWRRWPRECRRQLVAVGCVISAARRVPHPRDAQHAVHFDAEYLARLNFHGLSPRPAHCPPARGLLAQDAFLPLHDAIPQCGHSAFRFAAAVATCRACDSSAGLKFVNRCVTAASSTDRPTLSTLLLLGPQSWDGWVSIVQRRSNGAGRPSRA